MYPTHPTLAQKAVPGSSGLTRNLMLAVGGSLLLWASARLQVPFYPVPMTMQTFVVLMIGAAYGWRLGAATVALYLLQGALGMPVFAGTPEKGIGLAYMAGPTGGYLVGYVAAAAVTGALAGRGWARRVSTTLGQAGARLGADAVPARRPRQAGAGRGGAAGGMEADRRPLFGPVGRGRAVRLRASRRKDHDVSRR